MDLVEFGTQKFSYKCGPKVAFFLWSFDPQTTNILNIHYLLEHIEAEVLP